jgi:RND family efflux transporter MFP subunit
LLLLHPAANAAPSSQRLCLIEPYVRIALHSSITAPIAAIMVDRGSNVRKGQVLVTLDSSTEQAALEIAKYRAVMEGTVKSAEARLSHAKARLDRSEQLRKQSFVSAQDRDDAEAEMRVAMADLLEAKDNRELAKLEAQRLKAEVNRRAITSPINGVVTERLQSPGELAQIGDAAIAILKLAQTDPVRVEVVLPAAMYGKTKVGDRIAIKPEAPFTGSYRAVVKVVDRVIDSASGTFGIRLEIPNPKGNVLAGVKCTAEM